MRKGFTLLEILVALVIISSSVIVVFQLLSQGTQSLIKISDYQDLYVSLTNVMEDIDTIHNFEATPKKGGKAMRFDYEWEAVPFSPRQPVRDLEDGFLPYQFGLYKIVLKVYLSGKEENRRFREFVFYKTGWIYAAR
jgi:prepilin-type N-terminal cleavage/methylation domain-containing protein